VKFALLADLHSNIEAFDECLAHARRQGAERFVILGDLVGYNADPAAVIRRVRDLQEDGAIVVQGNHDEAAAGASTDWMHDEARFAIEWTRACLSEADSAYLAALPRQVRAGDCLFVHASAASGRWPYIHDTLAAAACLEATDATYVFCGHVHDPALYFLGTDRRPQRFQPVAGVAIPVARHRRWLAIVGACGQPRDGMAAACYAMFDDGARTLTYHRVPYPFEAAAAKVRAAGLPELFAVRLETGR
jgi:diadenosine tetraphosphatase ApaH/serine/threonine PP2A family protein phosphatase